MTANPLVAVVIPVYDRAHCVMDAVRSVLDQTHEQVECIVVDDGSRDRSGEVAAQSGDPRVRVLTQVHTGVSAARNHGLREARGSHVTFLDSDDVMVPRRIERQLELLVDRSCDAVIGRAESFAAPGRSLPLWLEQRPDWRNAPYWTSILLEVRHLRDIGGFDETLTIGEDFDLLVRLRGAGLNIAATDEVLTTRRFFGDNLSWDLSDETSAVRDAVRRHLARRRGAASG